MKKTKTLLCLICALCLLFGMLPAASADNDPESSYDDEYFASHTWEEMMEDFIADHETTTESVGLGYINLVTGEEHYVNADQFMVVGSVYKVPINMYFSHMVYTGEITWDTLIGGYRYKTVIEETLVHSNNQYAELMWNYLGGYQVYRRDIAPLMGEDPDNVDDMFYKNNYFTAREMIYCLNELYQHSDEYPKVIDYMFEGQPNEYFKAHEHDVEIAQKYGYLDDEYHFYLTDAAICYTEEPIAIVCYTDNAHKPYDILADYCDLMIAWAEWSTETRKAEEEEAREAEAIAELEALEAAEAEEAAQASAEVTEAAPAESGAAAAADVNAAAVGTVSETVSPSKGSAAKMIFAWILAAAAAIAAIVMLIIRSRGSKLSLPWAIGGVLVAAFAVMLCAWSLNTDRTEKETEPEAVETVGDPAETAAAFFDAVCSGDYAAADSCLSGVSTLGIGVRPESGAAQLMYDALLESYAYKLYEDPSVSGTDATQQVIFTYLDLDSLSADLQSAADAEVEKLVEELPEDEVYGENDEYLDSFLDTAYTNALTALLENADDYYRTSGIAVTLKYEDDVWKIVPDNTLVNALSGATAY